MDNRIKLLRDKMRDILLANAVPFLGMVPDCIPECGGVYLISAIRQEELPQPYYVGRTVNLRRRLYTNHLMGNKSTARLKQYLVGSGECTDMKAAKQYLRDHCIVQWILEDEYRMRGALEGFITAVLFPKYGIPAER